MWVYLFCVCFLLFCVVVCILVLSALFISVNPHE